MHAPTSLTVRATALAYDATPDSVFATFAGGASALTLGFVSRSGPASYIIESTVGSAAAGYGYTFAAGYTAGATEAATYAGVAAVALASVATGSSAENLLLMVMVQ